MCSYFDKLINTCNNLKMFEEFKMVITQECKMIDVELMIYYLVIEVKQEEEENFIS